jgi:hypothetical protein
MTRDLCKIRLRFEEAYRTAANEYDNAVLVLRKAEHTMSQQDLKRVRHEVELARIALDNARPHLNCTGMNTAVDPYRAAKKGPKK